MAENLEPGLQLLKEVTEVFSLPYVASCHALESGGVLGVQTGHPGPSALWGPIRRQVGGKSSTNTPPAMDVDSGGAICAGCKSVCLYGKETPAIKRSRLR